MGSLSRPHHSTRAHKIHAPQTGRRKVFPPTTSPPCAASGSTRPNTVPASALQDIHRKLEIAGAVAYICATLLREGVCEGQNVGLVLRRCVGDEIDRQMEEIDRLLGRERTFVGGEGSDE